MADCIRLPLLVLVLLYSAGSTARELGIHVLDVGEGQSVLLVRDGHAMLIDTGHAGMAPRVVERLRALGVVRLDKLVLTHLHPDHASGYFRIHEAYPEASVMDPCFPVAQDFPLDIVRWIDDALGQNPRRQCLQRGDDLSWRDVEIAVLWPLPGAHSTNDMNYASLVLDIEFKGRRLLVMRDANMAVEQELLASDTVLAPVDVLVVGHHAAADSSSEGFLERVRPRVSVISINRDNFRGYPDPATLRRLEQWSGSIHKTWRQGDFATRFK